MISSLKEPKKNVFSSFPSFQRIKEIEAPTKRKKNIQGKRSVRKDPWGKAHEKKTNRAYTHGERTHRNSDKRVSPVEGARVVASFGSRHLHAEKFKVMYNRLVIIKCLDGNRG